MEKRKAEKQLNRKKMLKGQKKKCGKAGRCLEKNGNANGKKNLLNQRRKIKKNK